MAAVGQQESSDVGFWVSHVVVGAVASRREGVHHGVLLHERVLLTEFAHIRRALRRRSKLGTSLGKIGEKRRAIAVTFRVPRRLGVVVVKIGATRWVVVGVTHLRVYLGVGSLVGDRLVGEAYEPLGVLGVGDLCPLYLGVALVEVDNPPTHRRLRVSEPRLIAWM